jgi:hypothetical protein
LKFAHNYVSGLILNLWLADRDPNRVVSSSGSNVIIVSSKGDSSQKTEITLNPATSLPMKETDISLSDPNHPVTRETKFERWRSVAGVKFPYLISKFQGGTKVAEIAVEQIKLNRGLRVADFSIKPHDQKPVMSQP